MPNKPATPQRELDISWRTRELGPEMRRELFRKVLPSVMLASQDDQRREPHSGHAAREGRARAASREGAGATAAPGVRTRRSS